MKKILFLVLALTTASINSLSLMPPRLQEVGESDADYAAYMDGYNAQVKAAGEAWQKMMQNAIVVPKK